MDVEITKDLRTSFVFHNRLTKPGPVLFGAFTIGCPKGLTVNSGCGTTGSTGRRRRRGAVIKRCNWYEIGMSNRVGDGGLVR
jgi:hypothetical protein